MASCCSPIYRIANNEDLGVNTLIVLLLIVAIAGLLDGTQRLRNLRRRPVVSTLPAHSVLHLSDQSPGGIAAPH